MMLENTSVLKTKWPGKYPNLFFTHLRDTMKDQTKNMHKIQYIGQFISALIFICHILESTIWLTEADLF